MNEHLNEYQRTTLLGRKDINSCFRCIFVHKYCNPPELQTFGQMRRSKCSLSVLKVVFSFSFCRIQKGNWVLNIKGKCLSIFSTFWFVLTSKSRSYVGANLLTKQVSFLYKACTFLKCFSIYSNDWSVFKQENSVFVQNIVY